MSTGRQRRRRSDAAARLLDGAPSRLADAGRRYPGLRIIYMYVYIYIYIILSIYLSIYLSLCIHIHIYIYICICIYTYSHYPPHQPIYLGAELGYQSCISKGI